MNNKRFLFVGNRFFVLKEMLNAGLNVVSILAVKNSYLEKELIASSIMHTTFSAKSELLQHLETTVFDELIANGCPYIIPVTQLAKNGRRFINIHPSYLPDLRGADPVPAALLYGRGSGATCHLMDDGIDTGAIISQVRIPYSSDLDAPLLYQLSFMAEREVFHMALARDFFPHHEQSVAADNVYYTKKPEDLRIDFTQSADAIVRRIKAFNNQSQGAFFVIGSAVFKVYDADIVDNPYLLTKVNTYKENAVVLVYENTLLIKKAPCYLKLEHITGNLSLVTIGDLLL